LLLWQWLESVKAKASNIRMAEKSYTFWASDDSTWRLRRSPNSVCRKAGGFWMCRSGSSFWPW